MANSLNHTTRLVGALIISGALNIALLTLIFYWSQQESPLVSYCSSSPTAGQTPLVVAHQSNAEVIRHFRSLPFIQLKANLINTEPVEEGYTHRDLALAALVAFHYFDLDRALAGSGADQQRRLAYGKYRDGRIAELTVYPGLSDKHYENIVDFASTEKWPLSSEGLFLTMKTNESDIYEGSSLEDAFYMTREFLAAEALFSTCRISPERHELLQMLLQGEWSMLASLGGSLNDISISKRQKFLMDYVNRGSKAAAYLLLKSDGDFALRRLDDGQVIHLLEMLDERHPDSERFALALLASPRTDAVWKKAAVCLYGYAGEPVPELNQHHAALTKFMPENTVTVVSEVSKKIAPEVVKPIPAIAKVETLPVASKTALKPQSLSIIPKNKEKDSLYVVQEGDSLWKISRRFNVDVACLKSHNRLDSDLLRPGKPLRIPKR